MRILGSASSWRLSGAVAAAAAAIGLLVGAAALWAPAVSAGPTRPAALAAKRAAAHPPAQHGAVHFQPRRGRFLGILPSGNARSAAAPPSANGTPPLTYHGGPVQHSTKVYALFWAPPGHYIPPAYRQAVVTYFKDVSADSYQTANVYAAATQFYDNTGPGGGKNWVSYDVTFGGSVVLTNSLPANGCSNYTLGDFNNTFACLVDSQIQTVISGAVSAHHWKTGLGYEYFLFTPPGLGECFDSNVNDGCYDPYSTSGYCAYHSNIGGNTLYAMQPWADLSGCQYINVPNGIYPNDDGADTVINVVSHEQNETMTDPLGNAWYDSSGYENGDECAWLAMTTHNNGIGDYSQTIHGDQYLMQFEWSNRASDCVGGNSFVQPSGSFTASKTGALKQTYSASASDSDDSAFTYRWIFGDGKSTLTASSSVSHTYAKGGTFTVKLVIFDAHGDQVRVIKKVSVS